MNECIFEDFKHQDDCTACSVANKLNCLTNHQFLKISAKGKKALHKILDAEIAAPRRTA